MKDKDEAIDEVCGSVLHELENNSALFAAGAGLATLSACALVGGPRAIILAALFRNTSNSVVKDATALDLSADGQILKIVSPK